VIAWPEAAARRHLGLAAAVALACGIAAACASEDRETARHPIAPIARAMTALPGDELKASPTPLEAPDEYGWADRSRYRRDLARHLSDLDRQIEVLRSGLRNGTGPVPREMLQEIAISRRELFDALARLDSATQADWALRRSVVYRAVERLDRAVLRARRAGATGGQSPARA
jgi:hypothetical protein